MLIEKYWISIRYLQLKRLQQSMAPPLPASPPSPSPASQPVRDVLPADHAFATQLPLPNIAPIPSTLSQAPGTPRTRDSAELLDQAAVAAVQADTLSSEDSEGSEIDPADFIE
jgi:hypothetical protein